VAPPTYAPDLLLLMASMQRFGEKLYFSAEAGNWPLADLYAHELEEAAEELVEGGFEKNDVDLGDFARASFLPTLERVEAAVRAGDGAAFQPAYADLVTSCNACHAATGYGLVRIIVPTDPARPYPSQDFRPAPAY
jgi:cytochrome c553